MDSYVVTKEQSSVSVLQEHPGGGGQELTSMHRPNREVGFIREKKDDDKGKEIERGSVGRAGRRRRRRRVRNGEAS